MGALKHTEVPLLCVHCALSRLNLLFGPRTNPPLPLPGGELHTRVPSSFLTVGCAFAKVYYGTPFARAQWCGCKRQFVNKLSNNNNPPLALFTPRNRKYSYAN